MSLIRDRNMKFLLHILVILGIFHAANPFNVYEPARNPWSYFGHSWVDQKPSAVFRKPMAAMVDLTNDLGVAILQDYSYSRSNFAFSPYGVASVLVVLYEGARGESARQIHRAVKFPWDRDITRIGFRDIHRHLRTYFSHEGYLSGITLSKQGSSLKPEYKRTLRFYGYDVDVDGTENGTDAHPPGTTESAPVPDSAAPSTTENVNATAAVNDDDAPTTEGNVVITSTESGETEETKTELSTLNGAENTTPGFYGGTTEEDEGSTTIEPGNDDVLSISTTEKPSSYATDLSELTSSAAATTTTTTTTAATTTESMDGTTSGTVSPAITAADSRETTNLSTTDSNEITNLPATDSNETTNLSTTDSSETTNLSTPPSEESTTSTDAEAATTVVSVDETAETTAEAPTSSEPTITTETEFTTELTETTVENTEESSDVEILTETTPVDEGETSTGSSANLESNKVIENDALDNGMLIPQESTNGLYSYYDPASGIIYNVPGKDSFGGEQRNRGITGGDSDEKRKGVDMSLIKDRTKWEPKTLEEVLLNSRNFTHEADMRNISRNLTEGRSLDAGGKLAENATTRGDGISDGETKAVNVKTSMGFDRRRDRTKKKRSVSEFLKIPVVPDLSLQLQNGMFDSHVAKDGDMYRALPRFLFLVDGAIDTPVPMMTYTNVFPFAYIPRLHSKALEFPLDDERYKLLIILPVERRGLRQLIYDLGSYPLREVIDALRPTRVKAMVPTFMVEGFVILTPTLQKMGIWDVFDPRRADLSGMSTDPELYVRNIEQSVTVVIRNYVEILDIQTRTMAARDMDEDFIGSHPFLYFVLDTTTNVALMAGQMLDPLNSRIY